MLSEISVVTSQGTYQAPKGNGDGCGGMTKLKPRETETLKSESRKPNGGGEAEE